MLPSNGLLGREFQSWLSAFIIQAKNSKLWWLVGGFQSLAFAFQIYDLIVSVSDWKRLRAIQSCLVVDEWTMAM